MIPVLQDRFRDPDGPDRGNCLQAALASVLELPLDAVPHFVQDQEDGGPHWMDALNKWLTPRNLAFVRVGYFEVGQCIGFAVGISPRDPAGKTNHIVVTKCREIIHDPHPDGTNLVGGPEDWTWWAFAVRDPAMCQSGSEAVNPVVRAVRNAQRARLGLPEVEHDRRDDIDAFIASDHGRQGSRP